MCNPTFYGNGASKCKCNRYVNFLLSDLVKPNLILTLPTLSLKPWIKTITYREHVIGQLTAFRAPTSQKLGNVNTPVFTTLPIPPLAGGPGECGPITLNIFPG